MSDSSSRGGGDHDGNLADGPQHAQRLVSIQAGQAEIEHDQIGRRAHHVLQRIQRAGRAGHGVSALGQGAYQRTPDFRVILHEQQLGHSRKVSTEP